MNRIVLRLMCDDRGEITFLFGPWGAVDRVEAIRQIDADERTYTLQRQDGSRVDLSTAGEGDERRLWASTERCTPELVLPEAGLPVIHRVGHTEGGARTPYRFLGKAR